MSSEIEILRDNLYVSCQLNIVEKVDRDLLCTSCGLLLAEPVNANCGCRYCSECIVGLEKCMGNAEECQVTVIGTLDAADSTMQLDYAAKRQVMRIRVRCLNCFELMELRAAPAHLEMGCDIREDRMSDAEQIECLRGQLEAAHRFYGAKMAVMEQRIRKVEDNSILRNLMTLFSVENAKLVEILPPEMWDILRGNAGKLGQDVGGVKDEEKNTKLGTSQQISEEVDYDQLQSDRLGALYLNAIQQQSQSQPPLDNVHRRDSQLRDRAQAQVLLQDSCVTKNQLPKFTKPLNDGGSAPRLDGGVTHSNETPTSLAVYGESVTDGREKAKDNIGLWNTAVNKNKPNNLEVEFLADVDPQEKEEANARLKTALEIAAAAVMLSNKGKNKEALRGLRDALKQCPEEFGEERARMFGSQAFVLNKVPGQRQAVLGALDKALALAPSSQKLLLQRSDVFLAAGRREEAAKDLLTFLFHSDFASAEICEKFESTFIPICQTTMEKKTNIKEIEIQGASFIIPWLKLFQTDPLRRCREDLLKVGCVITAKVDQCIRHWEMSEFDSCFRLAEQLLNPTGRKTRQALSGAVIARLQLMSGTLLLLSCQEMLAIDRLQAIVDDVQLSVADGMKQLRTHAYIRLGITCANFDTNMADLFFKHAIALDQKCPDIFYHRGVMCQANSWQEEAVKQFSFALFLEPSYGAAAVRHLESELAMSDHSAICNCAKGSNKPCGIMSANFTKFERLISSYPDCCDCYTSYCTVLLNLNRYDDVIRVCSRYMDSHDDQRDIFVDTYLSIALNNLRRFNEAKVIIEAAVQRDPTSPVMQKEAALLRISSGEYRSALLHYDLAIQFSVSVHQRGEFIIYRLLLSMVCDIVDTNPSISEPVLLRALRLAIQSKRLKTIPSTLLNRYDI